MSFDSNTGFELPNGATRSPDAAWMSMDKWSALSPEERQGLARVCPDLVIELRAPSDRLDTLHAKMEEYLENGARLGFLIDPVEQVAVIYRPGRPPERLSHLAMLPAVPEMPGLSLDLDDVRLRLLIRPTRLYPS